MSAEASTRRWHSLRRTRNALSLLQCHEDTSEASQVEVERLAHRLRAAVAGEVHFDGASRAMHATDASVYQILPLGVVTPRSREDVVAVVRLCREHGVSITARGGGTSQAGQAIGAGLSLDFSRYMNRVLDLDAAAATVTVEPGSSSMIECAA